MATTSTISILDQDKIRTIYVHYDGYPQHQGAILLKYYTTAEQVNRLIDLGDISVLGKYLEPIDGQRHDFFHPQKDVVVAYGRDRGETGTEARTYLALDTPSHGCREKQDYDYLFKDGIWLYRRRGTKNFIKLRAEISGLE